VSESDDAGAAEQLAERLAEASALADEDRWDDAYELLLDEEATHPDDPTLLCMLGVAAREAGADGQAYDFFRRCVAQQPADPILLATAGSGLAAWDDPDAERVLRLAALTAPQLALARLNYGAYLAREGLFAAAIDELEAAREFEPENATVHLELGVAYLLAGRSDDGLSEFADALALSPEDDWVQALFGLVLAEAGRMDEAAEQLHHASLARIDDGELQIAAALAAAAEGWEDEAWAALARADLLADVDRALIREAEERLEAGADAARDFLVGEIAAPAIRARILSRA
jgi:predicted Zn-dependent protease